MNLVTAPGIYEMSAEQYHADPCPAPSLSSSIARTLIAQSPRHAWCAHPRLNPDFEPEERQDFALGAAAHAYMLNDARAFEVIHADDFRTNAAKAQRDGAYAEGKVPILAHKLAEVERMVESGRQQIAAHREAAYLFGPAGKVEQTLVWQEKNGIWCRARLDWYSEADGALADYKTTGESADPAKWVKACWNMDADIQVAFYRRGLAQLGRPVPRFQFVVQENYPPFALSVIELAPSALDMAEQRVDEAIALWGQCLAANRWPAYPAVVCHVEAPPYQQVAHEERRARQHMMRDAYKKDHLQLMNDWQKPDHMTKRPSDAA